MTTLLVAICVFLACLSGFLIMALNAPLCDENQQPVRHRPESASEHVERAPL